MNLFFKKKEFPEKSKKKQASRLIEDHFRSCFCVKSAKNKIKSEMKNVC